MEKSLNYFILSHPLRRPLYAFLEYCNINPLEKKILDCGAGGKNPPLSLFYLNGFETHGIDISDEEKAKADIFCDENNMQLNIIKGDIRQIPFEDESFSFIYSINTTVHLSKHDNSKAIDEIYRVLKPEGLCCLNFISINDCWYNKGERIGEGEFIQSSMGYNHVNSYYKIDEPDELFSDFEILRKENRIVELIIDKSQSKDWQSADIWYILKKKSRNE